MRTLTMLSVLCMVGGCSLGAMLPNTVETTIRRIEAPTNARLGEPFTVTLSVGVPGCSTFSHVDVQPDATGLAFVFRAYVNREVQPLENCPSIVSYNKIEHNLIAKRSGRIELKTTEGSQHTFVDVE